MKRAIRMASAGVGVLAIVAGTLLAVSPANAAVEENCKTIVSTVVDRPDNGHGSPSNWALDDFTRTVKVCHVPAPVPTLAVAENVVPVQSWNYHVTVTDSGTFDTIGGAHRSPNNGNALLGGVHGTLKGGFTADVEAPADWQFFNPGALDGKTFTGTPGTEAGGPTTSTWVKALWTDGIGEGSKFINDWAWVYKTCNEYWIDAVKTEGGTTSAAGDITGYSKKPCARVVFEDQCDGYTNVIVFNDAPWKKAVLKFKLSTDNIVRALVGQEQQSITVKTADLIKVHVYGRSWTKFAEHTWKSPKDCVTPTPTATVTPTTAAPTTAPATSAPVTTPPATTTTTTPPVVVPNDPDDLPVTGASASGTLFVGGGAILIGAVMLIVLAVRRRRAHAETAD